VEEPNRGEGTLEPSAHCGEPYTHTRRDIRNFRSDV